MKPVQLFIFLLLFVQLPSFAQRLSRTTKDSLRIVLDEMGVQDQKYRWKIMYHTKSISKIDSINKLPIDEIKKILQSNKENAPRWVDSLSTLQWEIDIQNKKQLLEIINLYGFPSRKRVKSWTTDWLLLHFTSSKELEELNPIFLKELEKGNLPPKIYASWYDRILFDKGNSQLYGEYIRKYPCVENLVETNKARKKIGLKKLKNNTCK